jgi:DnaJ family protein C protein 3
LTYNACIVSVFSQVKECLKLDPDHKECFPFYKKVKKLAKQLKEAQDLSNSEQYDDCVKKANKILETENKAYHYVLTAKSHRCHCLAKVGLDIFLAMNVYYIRNK